MLYDSIILYFRVIYSNLFKNDVEVLEGAGVLVKSFPAGGFHDFNRIAFAKTHDPHTGPVTLVFFAREISSLLQKFFPRHRW
jgi:hypothetical protein